MSREPHCRIGNWLLLHVTLSSEDFRITLSYASCASSICKRPTRCQRAQSNSDSYRKVQINSPLSHTAFSAAISTVTNPLTIPIRSRQDRYAWLCTWPRDASTSAYSTMRAAPSSCKPAKPRYYTVNANRDASNECGVELEAWREGSNGNTSALEEFQLD